MILNNEEKKRVVDSLSWMIGDMKHRHDQLKGNLEEGSQGDYSLRLKEAMELLGVLEKVRTVETTGYHSSSVLVNCREFDCVNNTQGLCCSVGLTLASVGSSIVGILKCVEAEKSEEKDKGESNGRTL